MNEVNVEPIIGAIPQVKTTYWYVASSLQGDGGFRVIETTWIGGMSDFLRLTKGNVYLTEKEANDVLDQLNERYERIRDHIDGERQRKRIEEETERMKKEAEERRAEREKEAEKAAKAKAKEVMAAEAKRISNTTAVRAASYEANKKKRQKKSPHPDIIV